MNCIHIAQQVKEIAKRAGNKIKIKNDIEIFAKEGSHNYVTEMDKKISAFLEKELLDIVPESIVISEESRKNKELTSSLAWIIDPIDGTTNYIYHFNLSCISIALMENQSPVLGVVYNPFTDEMFCGIKNNGAYLNEKRIQVNRTSSVKESLILAETNPYSNRSENKSFSCMNRLFQTCVDIRITGSAALDVCYIASGKGSGFFTESLCPWDVAAGYIILEEAGGRATHWDGTPLTFKTNENIVASNGFIHDEMLLLMTPIF